MPTVCTPLTADTTAYTADSAAIRADMVEVCVTTADAVVSVGGSSVIRPIRKRARRPTQWDGEKPVELPVENDEALLLHLLH